MSKSHKKAVFKCGYGGTWKGVAKRLANKAVRSVPIEEDVSLVNGTKYKRHYNAYDICDYRWYAVKESGYDDDRNHRVKGKPGSWYK